MAGTVPVNFTDRSAFWMAVVDLFALQRPEQEQDIVNESSGSVGLRDSALSRNVQFMGRISLAWQILTNGAMAAKVQNLLDSPPALPVAPATPAPKPAPVAKPLRNDAVSLLATLQREGRLIDFLKEPIDQYSDAQVGAAVRDIHRDCGQVIERQFGLRPVLDQAEGSPVTLGASARTGRIRLSGNVSDNPPASGTLVHHGWQTTKCDLPVWTGDAESAAVVAPAEVEVR